MLLCSSITDRPFFPFVAKDNGYYFVQFVPYLLPLLPPQESV